MLGALFLGSPAQAQYNYPRHIERLEQRVQDAKARGDWGYASQLERDLNRERLQYQRRNGMGENFESPASYYYRYNLNNANNVYTQPYYYRNTRGYYDPWGNWRY